jgi:hypothetical protein
MLGAIRLHPLCLGVLLCLVAAAGARGAVLKVGSLEGAPDAEVSIPLVLEGGKKVGTVDAWLVFDPAVLAFQKDSETTPWENAMVVAKEDAPGTVHVAVITGAKEGVSADGPVAALTFKVVGKGGDETALTLKNVTAHNTGAAELFPETVDGAFAVAGGLDKRLIYGAVGAVVLIVLIAVVARRGKRGEGSS